MQKKLKGAKTERHRMIRTIPEEVSKASRKQVPKVKLSGGSHSLSHQRVRIATEVREILLFLLLRLDPIEEVANRHAQGDDDT